MGGIHEPRKGTVDLSVGVFCLQPTTGPPPAREVFRVLLRRGTNHDKCTTGWDEEGEGRGGEGAGGHLEAPRWDGRRWR